jgi:hypothetical protein
MQEPAPPGWQILNIETMEYGHESRGIYTLERLRWRGPVASVNYRPILSSEWVCHIRNLQLS